MVMEQQAGTAAGKAAGTRAAVVGALIDAAPLSRLQIGVVVMCVLVALLDGFDIATMALAVPLIAVDWRAPPGSFGPALSAAFVGIAAGGIVVGPLGDRLGRRTLVIASGMAIVAGSFASAIAGDMHMLIASRLLTGVGFGTMIPNLYALVADFMPVRSRLLALTMLSAAVSAGGMLAGVTAPWLVGLGGWPTIFVAGGILPLLLTLTTAVLLPESPLFLARRERYLARLRSVLLRMGVRGGDLPSVADEERPAPAWSVLLGGAHIAATLLLTVAWALNGLILYLLLSWVPTMLIAEGWESVSGLRSVTWLYGGALVGGLLLSAILDRHRGRIGGIMALAFVLGALALGLAATASAGPLPFVLALVGGTVGGTQYVLPGLVARMFPKSVVATALGWIGSLARLGAVVGPLAGGWMVSHHRSFGHVVLVLVVPALACAACMILLGKRKGAADAHAA